MCPTDDAAVHEMFSRTSLALSSQQRVHDGHHAIPFRFLGHESTASNCGDVVEASFSVVVGNAPFATQQTAFIEPHQNRIQDPHVYLDGAGRDMLLPSRNPEP